jgi:hypothetical protein
MKKLMSAVALCCLALTAGVRAQVVYTYSDMQLFTDSTPYQMFHNATMEVDYPTQTYYIARVQSDLSKTNDPRNFSRQVNYFDSYPYPWASASLPYDPDGEYEGEFVPGLSPYFRSEDGALLDHYNYSYYLDQPTLVPETTGAYPFYGGGPEIHTGVIDLLVGTLTGAWSFGAAAGPPHHVRVVSDDTLVSCGTKDRRFRLQVVDAQGRHTGTITIRELFFDAQWGTPVSSVYNTCRQEEIRPSGYNTTEAGTGGKFTDKLWVGCPTVSGDCGISTILSRWVWSDGSTDKGTLTTNRYSATRNSVLINGMARISAGTSLY